MLPIEGRLKEFHQEYVVEGKRSNYLSEGSSFLNGNDIYLHFTQEENLKGILKDGLLLDNANNDLKACYFTKEARNALQNSKACLVFNLKGLKDSADSYNRAYESAPEISIGKDVCYSRIIGYWIEGGDKVIINNKYDSSLPV